MAKQEKKIEEKTSEVKKPEEKKENLSRCELVRKFALVGVKDRAELADKVFAKLKTANKSQTKSGQEITLEGIKGQISSIVNVIKKGTQKHWKAYKIVEDEKSFKFVALK